MTTTLHQEVRHKYRLTIQGKLGIWIRLAIETVDPSADVDQPAAARLSLPSVGMTRCYPPGRIPQPRLTDPDDGVSCRSQTIYPQFDDLITACQNVLIDHSIAMGISDDEVRVPASTEANHLYDFFRALERRFIPEFARA